METGWLIDNGRLALGAWDGGPFTWLPYTDSKVIRFAREEDAQRLINAFPLITQGGIPLEHAWLPAPAYKPALYVVQSKSRSSRFCWINTVWTDPKRDYEKPVPFEEAVKALAEARLAAERNGAFAFHRVVPVQPFLRRKQI